DIDVQLKRRYDLIPNLVETVKGFAKQEKSVFKEVTEARSNAMQAQTPKDKAQAENALAGTLKSLFAVAEAYPQLKSNENFLDLQKQLSQIEDEVQKSRRYYNGNVRDFNTKIQIFPNNLVAPIFGFKQFDFFQADAKEKENVQVKF
ncbi:LemA family protein, partial [Patescibacteria group bacterium]|nr:LemA family protein [Patescibacteria group bacterium]